jgi:type III restriction enzyme
MRLPLKNYQQEAIQVLARYCAGIRQCMAIENPRPERLAYERIAKRDYYTPPGFEGVPYVCMRIPTGGGKTLMAAHAVGTIGDKLLGTDRPVCLWITPSTTIRDQTLRGLQRQHHPLRLALQDSLASDVEVLTLEDALLRQRAIQSSAALVIVTTIQSYRIDEETTAPRKIYEDNGYLQVNFHDVPEWARSRLARDKSGLVNLSLANAILLRRPIVVMDEAHNARTPISFDSLARFAPSFVLELTATPEQIHEPNHATKPRFASNVLHASSALELKNEGMIKLPVDLESREDWLEVLSATVQRRNELETVADHANQDVGIPFYRPVALIQAQAKHKTKQTHTVDAVKDVLVNRLKVPEHEVKICTGSVDEISDMDLMAGDCPVRYIITVDKLREDWDCPLAYVLGSIGNAATPTAVEQLIGRILRMPNANPTRVPALDRALCVRA